MSFKVLLVSLFLLFGASSIIGHRVDCGNPSATIELKKVLVNGALVLDVKTDHETAHVLVQKVPSDGGDKEPIMSVNADPNSVPNLTFWGSFGKEYESRTSVRTGTKSRESQDIIITIGSVEYADGGIYSVEYAQKRHKKCFQVYVHGPPTTPALSLVRGDCSSAEGSCARFICMSNSTTTPKNSDVPLIYTYSINGSSPDADSQSRYMVQNNELMIGGLTKADDNLQVTCEVQEENGHPKKVSTTYTLSVLPSDPSFEPGRIAQQSSENNDDGTFVAAKGTECSNLGWIAGIVVLLVILTASCVAYALRYYKRNKQPHPHGTADEVRKKLNGTELDETGSFCRDIDEGGGRPANG